MPALRSIVLVVVASAVGCGSGHADISAAGIAGRLAGESGVRLDDRGRNVIPAGRRNSGLDRAQAAAAEPATSGGYLVAISSQASEAEALASFKVLQAKYAAVLGQYQPIIKRLDFGEKGGVRFRVAVGPFETRQQASAMCGSLKLAGGQCFPFGSQ